MRRCSPLRLVVLVQQCYVFLSSTHGRYEGVIEGLHNAMVGLQSLVEFQHLLARLLPGADEVLHMLKGAAFR
jgi:hypothetical protein